jgi:hypothetical protein
MIYVYNSHVEDFTSHPNNVPIYRGTILGNPYTHDGKKSSLARLSFKTREEALNAYKIYFKTMYEQDVEFKTYFDSIYEKYKNGEDIYLQCFCKPLKCHGDIIAEELQKKLIKDNIKNKKRAT